jgi:hypothetical protein
MKFTENLPQEIMDKSLRAEHAPNIILDPNEVFTPKHIRLQIIPIL